MGRIVWRIIFVVSIGLNAAFLIHLLSGHACLTASSRELNLSAQQQNQLQQLRLNYHRLNESVRKEIAGCQERMLAELNREKIDKKQINQCIEKIGNLQKKLQQNTVEEIIQVKEFLSPQQCNCLIDQLKTRMKKQGGRP